MGLSREWGGALIRAVYAAAIAIRARIKAEALIGAEAVHRDDAVIGLRDRLRSVEKNGSG